MAVAGGLLVARLAQVQVFDNASGPQVKVVLDNFEEL